MRTSLRFPAAAAAAALLFAGCEIERTGPRPEVAEEVAVVVNSMTNSLTVVPLAAPAAPFTVGLGGEGSPVSVAARNGLAVVPLGIVPAVAVVDLVRGEVLRTVALPDHSGATGAAFLNDSLVLVGNPARNSVTPVHVGTGQSGAEIATGTFPHQIAAAGGRVYVLNAELEDWVPARPGTVTVLSAATLAAIGTVQLSGYNPGAAALGPDGRLYVLNSGSWGAGDGSLSVVDTATLAELSHHTGFGNFPGGLAVGGDGRVYVASFEYGVAVWHPQDGFVRAPVDAVAPGGIAAAADVAIASDGGLYSLRAECGPLGTNRLYRLDAAFDVAAEMTVGSCPMSVVFTRLPPS
jgi:hypothetical protein